MDRAGSLVPGLKQYATGNDVEIIMGRQLQTVSFRSTVRLLGFMIRTGLLEPKFSAGSVPSAIFMRLKNAQMRISTLDQIAILRKRYRPVSQRVVMAIAHAFSNKKHGPTTDQLFWTLIVRKILQQFRGLKCSNPRDKIYAALPLVLSSTHSMSAPNYDLAVADVYTQTALSFIHHEKSLSILADASQMGSEIPSWVPDYRYLPRTHSLCTLLDKNYRPIYRASGDLAAKYNHVTETYSQSSSSLPPEAGAEVHEPLKKSAVLTRHILTVHGVMLDKIRTLSSGPSDARSVRRPEWEKLLEQLPTYYAPSNEPVTDAYQRAFTADILSCVSIKGYEDFNTSQNRIVMGLGVLERGAPSLDSTAR